MLLDMLGFRFNPDVPHFPDFKQLTEVVKHEGKYYYISTNDTLDKGLETMIFDCKDEWGINVDWTGIYVENYSEPKLAIERHKYICEHVAEFIRKED